MPRQRPQTSGYARLSQADEDAADFSDDDPMSVSQTISSSPAQTRTKQPRVQSHMHMPSEETATSAPRRRPGRRRGSSSVDIKAINARLEKWADEIASKFKISRIKGKSRYEEQLEIHHSVFQAPDGIRPITMDAFENELPPEEPKRMTKLEFDDIVESVRTAIEMGVHPKMISQGSSGSYFARNSEGRVVGVFKPKDEEPYASRNPKWTKWIHRNLFPCFFGRACLIPNLSYVSEAAAYVLDTRLRTNIVPYTDVVHLSSKVFFYDFWQRSANFRKRKPLPEKPGSFQVFLKGFKDANVFLKDNPWPDRINGNYDIDDVPQRKKRPWRDSFMWGSYGDDPNANANRPLSSRIPDAQPGKFRWTENIKQTFREELEKLVILDYIMRNTDRGLDNWMVKIDWETEEVEIVAETSLNVALQPPRNPTESRSPSRVRADPKISLGAIDNSLSWPWKHPDAWRSFPFGWLYLPVSLIGQPFTQKTREHFLPLLTSSEWWHETVLALRGIFEQDSDFQERMFARQVAVMKGQAWNVVETLKTPDHGPLELTRRTRVHVWDDIVDIPVAVPMSRSSTEMQRRNRIGLPKPFSMEDKDDESDIGFANGKAIHTQGNGKARVPGQGSPPASSARTKLPNPNRFDLSRNTSASDLATMLNGPQSPISAPLKTSNTIDFAPNTQRGRPALSKAGLARHSYAGAGPRVSFQEDVDRSAIYEDDYAMEDGNDGDEDGDGDLGYFAIRGQRRNTRRVIVERLETVKGSAPVFTWC